MPAAVALWGTIALGVVVALSGAVALYKRGSYLDGAGPRYRGGGPIYVDPSERRREFVASANDSNDDDND